MEINLPAKVRVAIYITVVLGTSVLVPLNALQIISDGVILVWNSFAGAASLLAAVNVTPDNRR